MLKYSASSVLLIIALFSFVCNSFAKDIEIYTFPEGKQLVMDVMDRKGDKVYFKVEGDDTVYVTDSVLAMIARSLPEGTEPPYQDPEVTRELVQGIILDPETPTAESSRQRMKWLADKLDNVFSHEDEIVEATLKAANNRNNGGNKSKHAGIEERMLEIEELSGVEIFSFLLYQPAFEYNLLEEDRNVYREVSQAYMMYLMTLPQQKMAEEGLAEKPRHRESESPELMRSMIKNKFAQYTNEDYDPEKSESEARAEIMACWNKIKTSLSNSDIDSASVYFSENGKPRLVNHFKTLAETGKLEDFLSPVEELVVSRIYGIEAMCDLLVNENGKTFSYPARFVQEEDGQWRLDRL